MIYSESLDRYYTGCSENIEARLIKHLQNHKSFTSGAKDWKLVYSENFPNKELAFARENEIKNWKSRLKIE
ncbi:GIY-YIG nuclease family protein [Gramella sp. BOM4]|nr:GIY-YIG nuclease family protein [Christiangramia bathymodioli]